MSNANFSALFGSDMGSVIVDDKRLPQLPNRPSVNGPIEIARLYYDLHSDNVHRLLQEKGEETQ